jgi:hypothetical protein
MSNLLEAPKGRYLLEAPKGQSSFGAPETSSGRPWFQWDVLWKVGIAVAVAIYLLFAHGCHGDEDNELFARLTPIITR